MVPSGSQRVGKGCILVIKYVKKLENMRPGEVEKQLSGVLWWRVLHSLFWKSFSVEDVLSLILNHISGVFCHLSRFAVPFVAKARGENLRWFPPNLPRPEGMASRSWGTGLTFSYFQAWTRPGKKWKITCGRNYHRIHIWQHRNGACFSCSQKRL